MARVLTAIEMWYHKLRYSTRILVLCSCGTHSCCEETKQVSHKTSSSFWRWVRKAGRRAAFLPVWTQTKQPLHTWVCPVQFFHVVSSCYRNHQISMKRSFHLQLLQVGAASDPRGWTSFFLFVSSLNWWNWIRSVGESKCSSACSLCLDYRWPKCHLHHFIL